MRRRLFNLLTAWLLSLSPGVAFAGHLTLMDEMHLLSAQDAERLQKAAEPWSFDTIVRITTVPNSAMFDAMIEGPATGNVVSMGLDPVKHHTAVYFGDATGVPPEAFERLSRAGNGDFRAMHYTNGLISIGRSVVLAQHTPPGTPILTTEAQPTQPEHASGSGWSWVMFGLFIVLATYALYRARKFAELARTRARSLEETEYRTETRAQAPVEPAPAYTPPYMPRPTYAPPPPTVIHVNDGSSSIAPLVAGVLIGEALSTPRVVERERIIERTREAAPAPAPEPDYTSSTNPEPKPDSGSSSSYEAPNTGYDSGSSSGYDSGSSSDWGGGSSDWGGGSGFDSGSSGGGSSDY